MAKLNVLPSLLHVVTQAINIRLIPFQTFSLISKNKYKEHKI
jgi:hypothetical protein